MNSDDTNPHSPADAVRPRGANPNPLSMFESEDQDLATPPSANRYLLSGSEDPVHEVRQRLRTGTSRRIFDRSIARRLSAMRITISETVADIESRVTSRLRNYSVRNPKLLVPLASIGCVLIIAFGVGFAVAHVAIVPTPRQSAPVDIARNGTDAVQRSDSRSPVVSTVTTPRPADVHAAGARYRSPEPTQVKRAAGKSAGTVQPSRATVRSTPVRRTPAAELNKPAPARSPAPIRAVENVPVPAIALHSNPNPTPGSSAHSSDSGSSTPAPPVLKAPERESPSSNSGRVLSTSDPDANAIYSQEDRSVRPPRMIDIDLPRPAVANWATVRNSMEVVVAENGSVEHVKWLGSGERLPDVMLLSRAKLWKFSPAVKDGHAVRYKLVISWDVNP